MRSHKKMPPSGGTAGGGTTLYAGTAILAQSHCSTKIEHYGIYTAQIDEIAKSVTLKLQRKRDPIFPGQLEKVTRWVLGQVENKYPHYDVFVDGEE